LRIVLLDAGIKAFADANGVMPEVLADSINEKAMDAIGDNILDFTDELVIYEEYLEDVAEMCDTANRRQQ
jgi:hypothetical protein